LGYAGECPFFTFRTWRGVRLESAMHFEPDAALQAPANLDLGVHALVVMQLTARATAARA